VHASFVLREANVLDEAGGFTSALDVHVADGRVVAVGRGVRAAGASQVDCSGLWLLPGVFDCHNHVAASSLDLDELLRSPLTLWTLQAADNARRSLEAGVTFIRDPGGIDAGFRAAVGRGLLKAPSLQIAVVTLSQTGGHADGFLAGLGLEVSADYAPPYPGRPTSRVDGADAIRRAVREVLRAGADWVKVCATGGVLSAHDEGHVAELTAEEIGVAVSEAARRGKSVMAHAFGGEGLDNAVRAGVRSIEHGLFLTEEQASRMAAAGCWLVPTLLILEEVIRFAKEGTLPPAATRKALDLEPLVGEAVRVARDHGVKIAVGSDFISRDQHGRNLEELPLLVRAGLTVEETLLAATASGAELCGVGADRGHISPGAVFDAILLDDDPGDLSLFTKRDSVTGVFKEGLPVIPHERLVEAGLERPLTPEGPG
jgi:imidazolonepropionase-like amidohydrolase